MRQPQFVTPTYGGENQKRQRGSGWIDMRDVAVHARTGADLFTRFAYGLTDTYVQTLQSPPRDCSLQHLHEHPEIHESIAKIWEDKIIPMKRPRSSFSHVIACSRFQKTRQF